MIFINSSFKEVLIRSLFGEFLYEKKDAKELNNGSWGLEAFACLCSNSKSWFKDITLNQFFARIQNSAPSLVSME